jgi:uridylate kinase
MPTAKYTRILLKLNGEALAGQAGWGIDVPTVEGIAAQIRRVHSLEVQVCIVIGAGNIWRGVNGLERGMERATADYMGMLATVINALALQDALERGGLETRTRSSRAVHSAARDQPHGQG